MKMLLDNPDSMAAPFGDRFAHVARLEVGGGALLLLSGQVAVDDDGAVVAPGDITVQAERMIIGHLSYGFVISEQFRIEGFYDHAVVDDSVSGLENEPFQGVGIAGQTIGPYGTLLRLDIGKSIGRNKQDGFVANIVFLKLF